MTVWFLLVIALALALDAFGVALSIGLNQGIRFHNKIYFIMSFGFFQFLLSFIGAFSGCLFNTYVIAVPKIIGGVIIVVVGVFMIKEGMEEKDENILLQTKMYFILGISVSIDAMVVGFTALNKVYFINVMFLCTIFIGVISCIMTALAFIVSKYLKKIDIVGKYADYIGGITLIIFGLKMMFT